MTDDRENAEERYCLQALAELRRSYEQAAKPYIDRLVAIRAMRPAVPLVLTVDQAAEFIELKMGACARTVP